MSTWPFIEAVKAAWRAVDGGLSAVDAVVEGCSTCEELRCDGTGSDFIKPWKRFFPFIFVVLYPLTFMCKCYQHFQIPILTNAFQETSWMLVIANWETTQFNAHSFIQ